MRHASQHRAMRTTLCWRFALLLMVRSVAAQSSCEDEELALFQRDLSLAERSKAVMLEHPAEKEKSAPSLVGTEVRNAAAGLANPCIASLLSVSSSSRRAARRVGLSMRARVGSIAECVIFCMMVLLALMICLLVRGREPRQRVEDPRLPRSDTRWRKASDSKSVPQETFAPPRTGLQRFRPANAHRSMAPETYRIHTGHAVPETYRIGTLPEVSTEEPQLRQQRREVSIEEPELRKTLLSQVQRLKEGEEIFPYSATPRFGPSEQGSADGLSEQENCDEVILFSSFMNE